MQCASISKTPHRWPIVAVCFLGVCLLGSAQDRIRVGDSEGKKAVISRVDPVYPLMAKQMKIGGHVEVDAEVSPDGHVEKVDVVSGNTFLAGSCVAAVKQWKFNPFTAGGKPATALVRLGFNFSL